ncbi:hypothetical protein SAMN05421820_1168 [Pedobacter steynii]|uniref:Uncharacterized protein n=1 Tax=Pedobacter steynii TaxID=430522 RepID=A0A1H0KBP7_9SPHI|nr:hypothetical protein SAMN05421820_1168 [Pedobacter steynii]
MQTNINNRIGVYIPQQYIDQIEEANKLSVKLAH